MLVTEPARDGGKIVTGRKGVGRFEVFVRGVPAHAGTRPQDGRSAIRELANVIQALEAMTDMRRGVTVNVGVVRGGTKPNVIAEEAYAEVDLRVMTLADADEFVAKILNLKSRTEGVTVKVIGELNRPPYEKGNAGAALYEHAKTLAAEIGFDLVDTFTGGGSDGNFTAPFTATLDGLGVDGEGAHTHYRATVHFVDRAAGAAAASAVSDAAMSSAARDPDDTLPDDGAAVPAHGSFFGRRKGHKLRIHQADLIENLLPHLSIDIGAPAPADLATLFDPPVERVRLEIGFGGGEHLVAEALAAPQAGFIGCEPYVNGMAKILSQIEAHNIGNIKLFAGDAAELLAWAPPQSLDRIDLIHPDPWPKRRHWKRRFVQDANVEAMARVLKPAGEFRFVCDIDDYVAWTLAHLVRSPDFVWTGGARRRLAAAVGRLHHDALRPQSESRRTKGGVFAV